ncbi:MAG: HTTM domain-containing protein, partial [Pirellula sp.]
MIAFFQRILQAWERFLFDSCDPRVAPILRIGFAILVLIQTMVAWPDAAYWFTDDGVMQSQTAQGILDPGAWSLLSLLPSKPWAAQLGLICLLVHGLLMLVGYFSRFQAAAIFVWLISFQNRNPLITDGEDTVLRIFAFLMIWLPLDFCWAVFPSKTKVSEPAQASSQAWALRLIQFQMTAIYASTALSKLEGSTWQDGTAVWYVSRMTDNFGRLIPASYLDWPGASALATYGTLAIESLLPIGLWIPKVRWIAIGLAVLLHLGIESSMNLFLFQWLMLLGLIAFVRLP